MKKIFCKALMAGAALFASALLFGQTDQERLEAERNSQSRELSGRERTLLLLGRSEFAARTEEFIFGSWPEKRGHAIEKVYAVPKSLLRPGFSIEDAGVLMRSICKMQGMRYYSRSDKDWGVLYDAAYRIAEPGGEKIPDGADGSADGKTLYAFMDDHTFGKSEYKINYMQGQKTLAMFMENVSPLCYGPVKAVQPGGFRLAATVIDDGGQFLIHICDRAEFKVISALKKRLNNSFEARLEAICLWFIKMGRQEVPQE